MADSLQDQLRALGLAKKTAPKKKSKAHRKTGARNSGHAGSGKNAGEPSLEKAYALKRREEQKQADKARRKKQAEDRQRRQLNRQIREIVKAHRLNRDDAEVARNFMFKGRIRKINVTPEQLKELNAGALGIVYLSGGYHLVKPGIIAEVKTLSADHVVDLDSGEAGDDGEFPVPDDLTW